MIELNDVTLAAGGEPVVSGLSTVVADGEMLLLACCDAAPLAAVVEAVGGMRGTDGGLVLVDGEPLTPRSARWMRRRQALVSVEGARCLDTVGELLRVLLTLDVNRKSGVAADDVLRLATEMTGEEMAEATRTDALADEALQLLMLAAARLTRKREILITRVATARVAASARQVAAETDAAVVATLVTPLINS